MKTVLTNVERLKIMDIKTESVEEKEAFDAIECKCKQEINRLTEALAISQEENKELKQQLESK